MQKRGVLTKANYLQDVVYSVHLIYVARLYGVPASSTCRLDRHLARPSPPFQQTLLLL